MTEPIPCAYRFENSTIRIEWRGGDKWAVVDVGRLCLNSDGEWEYEPMPSNRDETFLGRCRFSFEEAVALARKVVTTT